MTSYFRGKETIQTQSKPIKQHNYAYKNVNVTVKKLKLAIKMANSNIPKNFGVKT